MPESGAENMQNLDGQREETEKGDVEKDVFVSNGCGSRELRRETLDIDLCAALGQLTGPSTILFISRDACSDSIANYFVFVFMGYRTIIARYMQNGVSHRCACVKLSAKGWGIATLLGIANLPEKYRPIWRIAATVSQYREILWGH